jgi:hypothetical protein
LKIRFFNYLQYNRGEFKRHKKPCLKPNAPAAEKPAPSHSSQAQANQFTVENASQPTATDQQKLLPQRHPFLMEK